MKNPAPLAAVLALALGAACQKPPPPAPATQEQASREDTLEAPAAKPQAAAPSPSPASPEACVDAWLSKHNFDQYGHPEGTMYAGGTPLFDERTGQRTDRLAYVFARHPEARTQCAPDSGISAPADAGSLPTR